MRREYCEKFIGPAGSGGGWSDGLQNLMLLVLLSGDGLTLYQNRDWDELPDHLRWVDENKGILWIEKLWAQLNRELRPWTN